MGNVFFNYQKTGGFGLAYPTLSFQEWLASTNTAIVVTNGNEKQTVNETEKKRTTSKKSDEVQTTKSRMK